MNKIFIIISTLLLYSICLGQAPYQFTIIIKNKSVVDGFYPALIFSNRDLKVDSVFREKHLKIWHNKKVLKEQYLFQTKLTINDMFRLEGIAQHSSPKIAKTDKSDNHISVIVIKDEVNYEIELYDSISKATFKDRLRLFIFPPRDTYSERFLDGCIELFSKYDYPKSNVKLTDTLTGYKTYNLEWGEEKTFYKSLSVNSASLFDGKWVIKNHYDNLIAFGEFKNSHLNSGQVYYYNNESKLIDIDTFQYTPKSSLYFGSDNFIFHKDSTVTDRVWITGKLKYKDDNVSLTDPIGFRFSKNGITEINDFSNYINSSYQIKRLQKLNEKDSSFNESLFDMMKSFFPLAKSDKIWDMNEIMNSYEMAYRLIVYFDSDTLNCIESQLDYIHKEPKHLLSEASKLFDDKQYETAFIMMHYHDIVFSIKGKESDYSEEELGKAELLIWEALDEGDLLPENMECAPWFEPFSSMPNLVRRWCNSLGPTKYKLNLK